MLPGVAPYPALDPTPATFECRGTQFGLLGRWSEVVGGVSVAVKGLNIAVEDLHCHVVLMEKRIEPERARRLEPSNTACSAGTSVSG